MYATLTCAPAVNAQDASPNKNGNGQLPSVTITETPSAATTEDSRSYTIDSMSTATGLGLSIRETPQSVSVVTRQQIEDRNLQTTAAILLSAPGISATRNDSTRYSVSSRGFVIDNFQFDGLASPISSQWNYGATSLSSAIYDRVEVVRGATGLMTGAGTPSAAVNFIRKRPLAEFAASATLSVGRWNNRTVNVDVSTPWTTDGKVSSRFVAESSEGDSYVSWLNSRSKTFYGIVTAELTPATRLSGGVEHQENGTGGFGGGFPLFYSDGTRTDFDRSVASNASWATMDTMTTTGFIDLTHRLENNWRMRAAYSHNEGSYDLRYVYRGGYPNRQTGLGMTSSFNNYDGHRRRSEFHLEASGPFSLLGRKHEASLGWMNVVDDNHIVQHPLSGAKPAVGSFFDWRGDNIASPVWSSQSTQADDKHVKQTGMYAATRFSLTDPLHLIVGGRISNWEVDQLYFGTASRYQYRREFVPYAGLVYDINQTYSVYTSYTGIFTPQNTRAADGSILPPIKGKSYEAGIKGAFLDGSLNGAVSVYQTRQENLAQAIPGQTVSGLPGTQAYRAASGAKVQGVELELAGQLTAAWNVSASYTRFVARDASGKAINTAQPSTLFKLFSSYQLSDKFMVGGGVDWQNRMYQPAPSPLGTVVVTQPGYAITNLMAKYAFNKRLSLALNINNLFDKKYYSQIGSFSQGWWGEPRNLMLTLRASY